MFFKLLEVFILRILFNKNEYNIKSKEFNPIKLFIILILLFNAIFSIYLIIKVNDFYMESIEVCPQLKKK